MAKFPGKERADLSKIVLRLVVLETHHYEKFTFVEFIKLRYIKKDFFSANLFFYISDPNGFLVYVKLGPTDHIFLQNP